MNPSKDYLDLFFNGKYDQLAPSEHITNSELVLILDAGHGGINPYTKEYVTAPNKMYKHPGNKPFHGGGYFYEGLSNRILLDKFCMECILNDISYTVVSYPWIDVSLRHRVEDANTFIRLNPTKRCIYISIHSDASGAGADGYAIWTTIGNTDSDSIATGLYNYISKLDDFPFRMREQSYSDGDPDYEDNFYVIKNTNCPAILIEVGFFDDFDDAMKLMDNSAITKVAKAHIDFFKNRFTP